jgi:hypothetical protein
MATQPGPEPVDGIVEEARRVVAAASAAGETLRITGGVAFQLRVAGRVALPRAPLADIDLVAPARSERRISALVSSLGYEPEKAFNAHHGDRRLMFWDRRRDRKLEVFVATFTMCHEVPIAERLELEPETVPLAELLLTKLQIVELNEKDLSDMHSLLITHEVGDGDGEVINAERIASLCARDWGLYHTVTGTLARLAQDPPSYTLNPEQRERVAAGVDVLRRRLDEHPKTLAWRMRARVGERVQWYIVPEEI